MVIELEEGLEKAEDIFQITQDEEESMDLGRVRRDLGFRGGAIGLPRLPDACGCFERQTRKSGAHIDRRARSARFLRKNGEKEREQNEKR
eukprot:11198023-Heterocapsa_arctica.AAC.1